MRWSARSASSATWSRAELTEALTDALGRRSGITDDVCVLALRRAGD